MLQLLADENLTHHIVHGLVRRIPVIDELLLIAECSTENEWEGRIIYLPL